MKEHISWTGNDDEKLSDSIHPVKLKVKKIKIMAMYLRRTLLKETYKNKDLVKKESTITE